MQIIQMHNQMTDHKMSAFTSVLPPNVFGSTEYGSQSKEPGQILVVYLEMLLQSVLWWQKKNIIYEVVLNFYAVWCGQMGALHKCGTPLAPILGSLISVKHSSWGFTLLKTIIILYWYYWYFNNILYPCFKEHWRFHPPNGLWMTTSFNVTISSHSIDVASWFHPLSNINVFLDNNNSGCQTLCSCWERLSIMTKVEVMDDC